MEYRELNIDETDRIKEIDATWYIKNAWRKVNGVLSLIEIDWTEYELPNGITWHMDHFRNTIENGGHAYGCFDNGILVGYVTLDAQFFGSQSQYLLLDQLFISKDYRNKKIGQQLMKICEKQAYKMGAKKLYICAASAENTIAFYKRIGCVNAVEINTKLYEQDTNDIQLELQLGKPVILFNGPSSSGKSTLTKALQSDLLKNNKLNYEIVSIDDFLKMTINDTLYEDDVYEISDKLCSKGLECLENADGLIIDHVITSERIFRQLQDRFSKYLIFLVHVSCPLDILKKRELERNNRCIGSAESSYEYLYPKEGYDLELDTHIMSTEECIDKLKMNKNI